MNEEKRQTAYEAVQIARDPKRFHIEDFIEGLFEDFVELHGDRLFRDDPSVIGGVAMFHDIPVTVIGHKKGRDTQENIACNFGMTSPEGYRKAYRLMEQAEKFSRPVITVIDTPGAYPGVEAESNGQSNAIAENLALMSRLCCPTIAIVTGEGSSGGALALAVSDEVFMLENAVYSILSPEGFASIMWKNPQRASEAAEIMKITSDELKGLGLIDEVIKENSKTFTVLDRLLTEKIARLQKLSKKQLVAERYKKYRMIDCLYRQ